jgi:hypothetical protein
MLIASGFKQNAPSTIACPYARPFNTGVHSRRCGKIKPIVELTVDLQIADAMEALDSDHECRNYWQGKLERLTSSTEAGPVPSASGGQQDLGVADRQDADFDELETAEAEEEGEEENSINSGVDLEWQPCPPPAHKSFSEIHGEI